MSVSHAAFGPRDRAQGRAESKALVVLVSALQLGLIVVVWLLALLPVAILALAATGVQAVRGMRAPKGVATGPAS